MTDDSDQHFPEVKIVPQMLSDIARFYCYAWKIYYINISSDMKMNFYEDFQNY